MSEKSENEKLGESIQTLIAENERIGFENSELTAANKELVKASLLMIKEIKNTKTGFIITDDMVCAEREMIRAVNICLSKRSLIKKGCNTKEIIKTLALIKAHIDGTLDGLEVGVTDNLIEKSIVTEVVNHLKVLTNDAIELAKTNFYTLPTTDEDCVRPFESVATIGSHVCCLRCKKRIR